MTISTIVTGASSGIGLAVAQHLIQEGHGVLGISRRKVEFQEYTELNFSFESLDLSDLSALKVELPALAKRYSEISAIVFCAGYGRFGSLEEFSYDQITELVNTNLTGQIFLAKTFIPQMKKRRKGSLVFVGSESVLSGGRRGAVYTASKSAIHSLAKSLRRECSGDGIHTGIVIPGMVKTEFYDQSQFTHGDAPENYVLPQDVAKAVSAMLDSRSGTVIDEILVTPLKSVISRKNKQ